MLVRQPAESKKVLFLLNCLRALENEICLEPVLEIVSKTLAQGLTQFPAFTWRTVAKTFVSLSSQSFLNSLLSC